MKAERRKKRRLARALITYRLFAREPSRFVQFKIAVSRSGLFADGTHNFLGGHPLASNIGFRGGSRYILSRYFVYIVRLYRRAGYLFSFLSFSFLFEIWQRSLTIELYNSC